MSARILHREPDRAGQLCGYQSAPDAFCGERKADGLHHCPEHHEWVALDDENGVVRMAPGNAVGDATLPYDAAWERNPEWDADAD